MNSDIIEYLILEGAAEVAGIDMETGDMLYKFTPALEEQFPEIYREVTNFFHNSILKLWELGFLDMDVMSSDPSVRPTEFAYDPKAVATLGPAERHTLEAVIQQIQDQEYN